MPCAFASSDCDLRKASSSVMSASSFCVTCGMLSQLRCRKAPGQLPDARQRLRLDGAELREIDRRHRRQIETQAAACGASRTRELRFHVGLHVFLQDALLGTAAFDFRQIDAELARETAHRRARVRLAERSLVDRRRLLCGSCGGALLTRRRRLLLCRRRCSLLARGRRRRRSSLRCSAALKRAVRRFRLPFALRRFEHQHERALRDLVADFHAQLFHHARRRRRALPSSPCPIRP